MKALDTFNKAQLDRIGRIHIHVRVNQSYLTDMLTELNRLDLNIRNNAPSRDPTTEAQLSLLGKLYNEIESSRDHLDEFETHILNSTDRVKVDDDGNVIPNNPQTTEVAL